MCYNERKKVGGDGVILLCYEKLLEVIQAFEQATGWKTVLWDHDRMQMVATPYAANPFCCELQRLSGCTRCEISDGHLLDRCRESRRVEMHTCHAGFTDLCVPLLKGEQLLGFLILGQIRLGDGAEPSEETLALFPERDAAMALYESTPVVTEEKLFSVVKIATMLASYILSEQMISAEQSEVARRLTEYVEEHYAEGLTVERICRELHLSRSALYRLFESNIGEGVKHYVTAVRIKHAEQMLAQTNLAVSEICVRCGIESVHYFCRTFKKKTGKTPLEYREFANKR